MVLFVRQYNDNPKFRLIATLIRGAFNYQILVFKQDVRWRGAFTKAVGIFTHTGNTTLLFHVAEIVKPECCTCSQGKVLRQNRWDNVAEYASN